MLKTIHTACAYLIIALGVLHLLFTFHDYDEFTPRALWFASAGFAISRVVRGNGRAES